MSALQSFVQIYYRVYSVNTLKRAQTSLNVFAEHAQIKLELQIGEQALFEYIFRNFEVQWKHKARRKHFYPGKQVPRKKSSWESGGKGANEREKHYWGKKQRCLNERCGVFTVCIILYVETT